MKQLLKKQSNAVFYLKDDETTEVIYGGAAGGGKTALGCLWLIECCQKFPGSRWLMGRSKLTILKDTTVKTFNDITKELGIRNQFHFPQNSNKIRWHNGSEILLKDLFLYPSDPEFDSLGSLEITGAFIDECNQISYKAWQVVKSRCRYRLDDFGLIPKVLGTCNPSKNWVYKQFYSAYRNDAMLEYRKFVQALPKDNPYLPDSYIENLLQLPEASRKRLHDGDWEYDDDPATLIDMDAILDYFKPVHIKPQGQKYITVDVARKGKDKSVVRVWHGYVCIERHEYAKNEVTQLANVVRKLMSAHGIPRSRVVADEDGVGGGVVDILGCKGFVNNSRAVNGENFANLKSQCSIHMARLIMERKAGELNATSEIMDMVGEEMEQVKEANLEKDGPRRIIGKDVIKANIGRSPDDWDSIMMRYYFDAKPPKKAPKARMI